MIICYNLSRVYNCSNFSLNVPLNKLLRVIIIVYIPLFKRLFRLYTDLFLYSVNKIKAVLFVEFRCKPQNSRTHFLGKKDFAPHTAARALKILYLLPIFENRYTYTINTVSFCENFFRYVIILIRIFRCDLSLLIQRLYRQVFSVFRKCEKHGEKKFFSFLF